MRTQLTVLIAALTFTLSARAATPDQVQQWNTWFEDAGREFQVPALVLKAIAFSETRWSQLWREEEQEHPPVYTLMGLHDDDWFGHSLPQAARLIHVSADSLKADVHQSIRAGAAYLASLHQSSTTPGGGSEPLNWIQDVKRYSGIPEDADANLFAAQVFRYVGSGFEVVESGSRLYIPGTGATMPLSLEELAPNTAGDEEQLGIPFDPSPNFEANAIHPKAIIIHVTDGSYAGAVSWLKNPKAIVSAHFVMRSSDGHGVQLVHESDKAKHVRCWNPIALGIEHEGWEDKPQYFTDTMLKASARLVRTLASKHKIPVDDTHVVGHNFWKSPKFPGSVLQTEGGTCNDHTDPGPFWDWKKFYQLISDASL